MDRDQLDELQTGNMVGLRVVHQNQKSILPDVLTFQQLPFTTSGIKQRTGQRALALLGFQYCFQWFSGESNCCGSSFRV